MRHGAVQTDEITGRHLDWPLFRRFFERLAPHRAQCWCALLLTPLVAAVKLVQPYLIMVAIDRHIVPGDLEGLPATAALFLLALALESLFLFFQGYLVQAVGQKIMASFRAEGFRRLLRLPVPFFDRHPSGRLVTRLTGDVESVGELFGAGIIAAFGDILTLVFIVALMLWINAPLSLVAFAVLPLLLLAVLFFRGRMRTAMRAVRARIAGMNAYVAERIAGAAEVRLFGQENRTIAEFDDLQKDYLRSTFGSIGWDAGLFAIVEALGAVAMAAVLWKGGGEVLTEMATFGTLVAFIEYVQKFFAPLRDLSAKYAVLQSSNASLERIFDLLDQETEGEGKLEVAEEKEGIVFEEVDFSYDGLTPVLEDISIRIAPGETVALVGATGSGKTTLARLLLRFYSPSSGRILLGSDDLQKIDPEEVRRRIGWVGQEPFVFAGTVRENLDPEGLLSPEALEALLAEMGCGDAVRKLGGLHGRLKERGRNLSSGQRQLLCLVRALVPRPQLLVLDEATSRLDAETEELVAKGIERARRKGSVLLIAHRLRQAQDASRIIVLGHGRIREEGTHRELMERNGLYARLWKLQSLAEEAAG